MTGERSLTTLWLLLWLGSLSPVRAYSVLTHEAIVDAIWDTSLKPALLARFPGSSKEQLKDAHAYAYGGCIIQDLGYYPFGSHFFSDLVHYVRSGDFVQALVAESRDVNEYAFALGALAHYGADIEGHSIAVNHSVPILYPKLRRKFGNNVTYEDNPGDHLKTEFGFDVLQVARGHYAPETYHDFIGFEVSKDLLERAFQQTYGLSMKDVFHALDLSLGTYRFTVSTMMPKITKTAWSLKSSQIMKEQPSITRKQFLFNIRRSSYEKYWGRTYERPGFGVRFLAFLLRLVPHIGPFRTLAFKVPTPPTEKMFEDSFDTSIARDRKSYAEIKGVSIALADIDLDTGNPTHPGEYKLADNTYDELLNKLADKKFVGVTPVLRDNILKFYAGMKTLDTHRIGDRLAALKAFTGSTSSE